MSICTTHTEARSMLYLYVQYILLSTIAEFVPVMIPYHTYVQNNERVRDSFHRRLREWERVRKGFEIKQR